MNIRQIQNEIETWGIDPKNINIGDYGYYEDKYNLIHRKDGKWEIFFGQHGQEKIDQRLFDTEEEACDAFLKLLRENINSKTLSDRPKYSKRYRRNMSLFQYRFILGIFIFGAVFGVIIAGVQLYYGGPNWILWFWLGWIAFFVAFAVCWKNERTYELFEEIAGFMIFALLSLAFIAVIIGAPIYFIPRIISGEESKEYILSLIIAEPCLGATVVGFYHFELKDKINDLKEFIREKKESSTDQQDNP